MTGKTIAKKLHEIQNAISGANNQPEISSMLSSFGYDAAKIAAGQSMLDNVKTLMAQQIDIYGDQYAATDAAGKNREQAYSDYMVVIKVIRVAFKGDVDALKSFMATGQRSKSLSGWLREAHILYSNLLSNPNHLAILANYGITQTRISDGLQRVKEIEELYGKQLEKKGEAQQSTLDRDRAFDELTNWYSDFRAIARIALYEKPQLLEVMGIVVKR